jgi:5S rRNA maturation endonuclease (ribonuclease M5)
MIRPDKDRREDLERQLEILGRIIRNNAAQCPNPGHQDEKPSASIYQKDGHWRVHCHVCEKSWDAWDLAAQNAGLELSEWIKQTAEETAKPIAQHQRKPAYATMEEAAEAAARAAGGKAVDVIHQYLEPGIQTRFAVVRTKPKDFRPIHKDEEGWRLGDLPGKLPLYNLTKVVASEALVICEGEKDCDTLGRLGIPATTSAHGAKSADKTDWTPLQGKRIAIWPDNDEAGSVYAQRVRLIIDALPNPSQIRQVDPNRLPVEAKDVSDLVDKLPPASDCRAVIKQVLKEAEPSGPINELNAYIAALRAGTMRPALFGFDMLDKFSAALVPGATTFVAGGPGSGKSNFIVQTALSQHRSGERVALLMLEEQRTFYLRRIMALLEGDSALAPGYKEPSPDHFQAAVDKHAETVDEFGRCIWANRCPGYDAILEWIRARIASKCRVVYVDPITLATAGLDKRFIADEKFMQAIIDMMATSQASLVFTIHPKKGRIIGRPDRSDMAGGQVFANAAQNVLWIERLGDDNREVIKTNGCGIIELSCNRAISIVKSRNGSGDGMRLAFSWDSDNFYFMEHGTIQPKKERK